MVLQRLYGIKGIVSFINPPKSSFLFIFIQIHYFGRKIQDARSALAVVGGKVCSPKYNSRFFLFWVVLVSELYSNLVQRRHRNNAAKGAFVIENLYVNQRLRIPFIPADIRMIKFIDQPDSLSRANSTNSCRFCQSMGTAANHV